jgi:hypothetical protein
MTSRIVVCLSIIVSLSLLVVGCSRGEGGPRLPIKVEGADRVGTITLRLLYDPTVFEVTGVGRGPLAVGGTLQWGIEVPGQLNVVIENDYYLNGNGTLVEVYYEVLNSAGSSTLTIQVLEAKRLITGDLLQTQVSDGRLSPSDVSVEAPVIAFSA